MDVFVFSGYHNSQNPFGMVCFAALSVICCLFRNYCRFFFLEYKMSKHYKAKLFYLVVMLTVVFRLLLALKANINYMFSIIL